MSSPNTARPSKPLVERLRHWGWVEKQEWPEGAEAHGPSLYDEAADEIERLRAALEKIAYDPGVPFGRGAVAAASMRSVAREALGLKAP